MHASFSFHHSNLQLAYTTQAWIGNVKTYGIKANICNAYSNATYKFMSLLPLLVLQILIDPLLLAFLPLSYYLCESLSPFIIDDHKR
jgi:hypothetical protein